MTDALYVLSLLGATVGGALVVIGAVAALCARRGAYPFFSAYVALLALGAAGWLYANQPGTGLRALAQVALEVVPVGVLYVLAPGLYVKRGESKLTAIFLTTALATLVATPLWVLYSVYVSCFVGHDCL